MNFTVIAVPPEQFEIWAGRQQQPPAAVTGQAAEGEQIFLNGSCVTCHTVDGTTAQGVLGPNLTHFGSRQTIAGLMLKNTPENLTRWLSDPQAVKPRNQMLIDKLNQTEIEALVAYLSSLY
jgi:cytochrome c oxidase subunit 2